MNQKTTDKAAFFFGIGVMGVLAGFGLGSRETNKVALLIGVGSLAYANHLTPMIEVSPRPELAKAWDETMPSAPTVPSPPGGWEAWASQR